MKITSGRVYEGCDTEMVRTLFTDPAPFVAIRVKEVASLTVTSRDPLRATGPMPWISQPLAHRLVHVKVAIPPGGGIDMGLAENVTEGISGTALWASPAPLLAVRV
jgi:hypothetical protein